MDDKLPRDVTELLSKHIHGLSQLELLLFIHADSAREVSASMAARELRMPEAQIADLLDELAQRGFLKVSERQGDKRYSFHPTSTRFARQVDALADTWPRYRHSIIRYMFSRPPESVTNFSEAFRLRKDEDDG